MEKGFITLRGHHVEQILSGLSLNEWDRFLSMTGYIDDLPDLSREVFETFERIKGNPRLLVKLTDAPDDICYECSKEDCSRVGEVIRKADRVVVESYGFEVDGVYTAEEVLSVLRPREERTKRYWREELRRAESIELGRLLRR